MRKTAAILCLMSLSGFSIGPVENLGLPEKDIPKKPTESLSKESFESFTYNVSATNYHAVEGQTDATPFITADGSRIIPQKLKAGEQRWIAVSQDFIKKGILNYGDTVIIKVTDKTYWKYSGEQYGYEPARLIDKRFEKVRKKMEGKWVVHDCMNRRFKKKIDFLVPVDEKILSGYWGGIQLKFKKKKNDVIRG